MINAIAANSYVGTPGARLRLIVDVPAAAAAWPLTDAVRVHVMATQLKRTTDAFPSKFRGTDPPV